MRCDRGSRVGGLPEKAPLTWAERAGALPRVSGGESGPQGREKSRAEARGGGHWGGRKVVWPGLREWGLGEGLEVLGWPKSLFGFACMMVWGNPNEPFGQPSKTELEKSTSARTGRGKA